MVSVIFMMIMFGLLNFVITLDVEFQIIHVRLAQRYKMQLIVPLQINVHGIATHLSVKNTRNQTVLSKTKKDGQTNGLGKHARIGQRIAEKII